MLIGASPSCTTVRLPFSTKHASPFYHNTCEKGLATGVTTVLPTRDRCGQTLADRGKWVIIEADQGNDRDSQLYLQNSPPPDCSQQCSMATSHAVCSQLEGWNSHTCTARQQSLLLPHTVSFLSRIVVNFRWSHHCGVTMISAEVSLAYRRLCLRGHPSRGGAPRIYLKLQVRRALLTWALVCTSHDTYLVHLSS